MDERCTVRSPEFVDWELFDPLQECRRTSSLQDTGKSAGTSAYTKERLDDFERMIEELNPLIEKVDRLRVESAEHSPVVDGTPATHSTASREPTCSSAI